MSARRALWVLIAVSTLYRLALASVVGPGNDEAYHYLFAVHPAWSYFDHPPMLAVVEAAGLAVAGGHVSALALRLGFIALFAGSTWLMARLTARFYGDWAGVLAAFALNVTLYFGLAAGMFALPDGPLLFFWLLTLDRLASALASPGRIGPWIAVGLAWGGAMLSKYHAVFLPAGAFLYLIMEPSARRWLRRPGPYLAVIVGLIVFAPVIWWNANHGWASFAFQGGRALGGLRFRPETLAMAIGGSALYLFPWIWIALVMVLVRTCRRLRSSETGPADRFLICQSVLPFAAFAAVACLRPVLPHWSLVGFLPIMPMLGQSWARRLEARPVRMRRVLAALAIAPVVLAGLGAAHTRWGILQRGGGNPIGLIAPAEDATVDLYGWDQVARELERRGLTSRPDIFLFTSRWYHSGHLAFALRTETPVLCYSNDHAQGFAYWSRPEDEVGCDGILIGFNDCAMEAPFYASFFRRIEPIGGFAIVRGGVPVREVQLFRCVRQTWPFPIGNGGPRPARPPASATNVAAGLRRNAPSAR